MAISSTTNRVSYSGNGVTTVFPYPYRFLANADLKVVERVTATGVETTKTLTTHYTLTGAAGLSGGSVTMLVAPASGTTLTIYNDPLLKQEVDMVDGDPLPADTIENALDQLTIIAQRNKDLAGRSVRLMESDSSGFDPRLPAILTAGTFLRINDAGTGFEIGPIATDIEDAQENAVAAVAAAATATAAAAAAAASAAGIVTSDAVYGPAWDGNLNLPTKNAVYDKMQSLDAAKVNVTDGTEVVFFNPGDFSQPNAGIVGVPQFPWSAPNKLTNPTTAPAGSAYASAFSPNGEFLAVGSAGSPYIQIYQRRGTEFVKLANPGTLPTAVVQSVAWSSDSQFLACATSATPFVIIYQRAGSVFTKVTDPVTLPAASALGVAFSPNTEFLSVAHNTTPFVTTYQRAGAVFTKLTNPGTLPAGTGTGASWSKDGRFLAVTHATTPFVTIYERSAGTTFTKLTNPGTLPAATTQAFSCDFSQDGLFLAVSGDTSPYFTLYTRSGTTFTKVADAASLPNNGARSVCFSPNSRYLAVGYATSPFLIIYSLTAAGVMTALTALGTTVPGAPLGTTAGSWTRDMQYFSFAGNGGVMLHIYQTASEMSDSTVMIVKKIPRDT